MARVPDLPCADCGQMMWRGTTSLPEGQARCRPCRRAGKSKADRLPPGCQTCGAPKPSPRHRYCEPCRVVARKRHQSGGSKLPRSERGYGPEHDRARRAAVAAHKDTDPCARCGAPLGDDTSVLDLDHTDDRTGYLGLSHRSCNRSSRGAGALIRWPHVCDHCGLEFRSSCETRRFCSVPCYKAAPRPKRGPKPHPARQRPAVCKVHFIECERCDCLFAAKTRAKRFCSEVCLRGRPEVHHCSDCLADIPRSRRKCDECVALTKRRQKQTERRSEGGRRRAREAKRRRYWRKKASTQGGRGQGAVAA